MRLRSSFKPDLASLLVEAYSQHSKLLTVMQLTLRGTKVRCQLLLAVVTKAGKR